MESFNLSSEHLYLFTQEDEQEIDFNVEPKELIKPNNKREEPETKVVNKFHEHYDVYIGRGSKWGNPFTHIKDKQTKAQYVVNSREEAIEAYHVWITRGDGKHLMNDLHELKGKTLGCFCKPKSCHGDVLVQLVEEFCYG